MKLYKLLEKVYLNPKKLFLIDAIGALVSAFLLGIVLTRFEKAFAESLPNSKKRVFTIFLTLGSMILSMTFLFFTCFFEEIELFSVDYKITCLLEEEYL